MKCKKNKRTLKKRIRTVVSLCILFTVIFFGGLIISLSAMFIRTPAEYITNYVSFSIANEMNSQYFLKQYNIPGLEKFKPDTPKARDWFETLKDYQNPKDFMKLNHKRFEQTDHENDKPGNRTRKSASHDDIEKVPEIFNTPFIGSLVIELNSQVVFSNIYQESTFSDFKLPDESAANSSSDKSDPLKHMLEYFSSIRSYSPLFDSNGVQIGTVSAGVNPYYLLAIYIITVFLIVLAGLFSLIVSNIISKFLTIPAISPLYHLEETFRKIASEDFNPTDIRHIQLKRPLREIENLVNSTNLIMEKLNDYNKTLSDQKLLVESQNEELEAQNEELAESKRQIEEAQALLVQSENMASIGQLTAAITHEINTPLGAINSNVQLCDLLMNSLLSNSTVQADTELFDNLSQIREANSINVFACQRVAEIIKSLKTFSRLDQAEFQEANLIDSLKSVLVLTSNLWKKKISVHEDYEPIPLVKCFPGLLNQVFMNIIVNAIQSIENKGDIYIRTYTDDSSVFVSIKDTGSGIKEENLSRIFESGFSTKGAGLGMGLGLSICKNIVRKHNGDIEVRSEIGNGTEFIVRIPLNPEN